MTLQKLGYCARCHNPRVQWLYNAVDPETGRLVAVCVPCERQWANLREPPMSREEYELALRGWRKPA